MRRVSGRREVVIDPRRARRPRIRPRRDAQAATSSAGRLKTFLVSKQSHGSASTASPLALSAIAASTWRPRNSWWLVAMTTASASRIASSKDCVGVAHVRVVHRHVGQLALEQADELVRQRVALVVGVAP